MDESIDIVIGNNKSMSLGAAASGIRSIPPQDGVCGGHQSREAGIRGIVAFTHGRAHPGVYQGAGWLQSVLHILYYSVCERACQKQGASDVLQEIRTLAKSGYREVVLTGIHLSSYGVDNGGVAAASDRGGT